MAQTKVRQPYWLKFFTVSDKEEKSIIVQKGKYGKSYYDASTQKAMDKSCRKMFENFKAMSFYDSLEEEPELLKKNIKELEESVKPLPEGLAPKYYEVKKKEEDRLKTLKGEYAEAVSESTLYKKANAGDLDSIKELLIKRKDYEYEEFSIETLS